MSKPVRVLVTGSRDWDNEFLIHNVLTSFHWMYAGDDICLVSGACETGADAMCEKAAAELGWQVLTFPALWDTYGRRAGPMRNGNMVDFVEHAQRNGEGAICLAFILDDSKGATGTADLAEKAGIQTLRYKRYTNGLPTGKPDASRDVEPGDPDILRAVEVVAGSDRVPEGQGHYR